MRHGQSGGRTSAGGRSKQEGLQADAVLVRHKARLVEAVVQEGAVAAGCRRRRRQGWGRGRVAVVRTARSRSGPPPPGLPGSQRAQRVAHRGAAQQLALGALDCMWGAGQQCSVARPALRLLSLTFPLRACSRHPWLLTYILLRPVQPQPNRGQLVTRTSKGRVVQRRCVQRRAPVGPWGREQALKGAGPQPI